MREPRLTLDSDGSHPVADDAVVIDDEAALLRHLGSAAHLHVRGQHLCAWAERAATLRGWPIQRLTPLAEELQRACPRLSDEQLTAWLGLLEPCRGQVARPVRLEQIAVLRWPELPINDQLGRNHAAAWLSWLCQQAALAAHEQVLLAQLGASWARACPDLAQAYAVSDAQSAWQRLAAWLGVCAAAEPWPSFPWADDEPLPQWISARLEEHWEGQLLERPLDLFKEVLTQNVHPAVRSWLAQRVADVIERQGRPVPWTQAALLQPYLATYRWQKVQRLAPPPEPAALPEHFDTDTFAQVRRHWFVEQYLPFRQWQSSYGGPEHAQVVSRLARAFGERYLHYYASISASPTAEVLSWRRMARLSEQAQREQARHATLVLILDGLAYHDAQVLAQLIGQAVKCLSQVADEPICAPLPTITRFAKSALTRGLPPRIAHEFEAVGTSERTIAQVIAALSNPQGPSLVLWPLLEPDKSYHQDTTADETRERVQDVLQGIVRRVARIVEEVPAERQLRIVITTDHGRLLAHAARTITPPRGCQAHGRAAWGQVRRPFDATGVIIEGDLAWLDPRRFELDMAVAVLLSGEAFTKSNGAGGVEPFPHGGVYPEEVLIPWLEWERARVELKLRAVVRGSGMAGATGWLELQVDNHSELDVRLLALELPDVALQVDLVGHRANAQQITPINVEVAAWPDRDSHAPGLLRYALLNGNVGAIEVSVALSSTAIYRSNDDILDQLG
ncbi:hypothetical protein [Kallotenue papyrolyticum]|uniref:hypothetical protein n=1 Tax=Kallotenue papyrolyticum TaxID=1325125 RepID=UPI0004785CAC|nr:hypothetical protein [Kallotenue papyrolyticum]